MHRCLRLQADRCRVCGCQLMHNCSRRFSLSIRLCCAVAGASVASLLVLPRASYSLGASGAVFGLYAVSVLLKLSSGLSLRKFVEASSRLGYPVLLPLLFNNRQHD